MKRALPLLAILPLALVACTNKLTGDLDVSGKKFEPESCKSGQGLGFSGVEITAKDGRRVRLQQTASGDGYAFLFESGSDKGEELGKCGSFALEQQSSTINNIRNVKGTANLDCHEGETTLKGSITFENCH